VQCTKDADCNGVASDATCVQAICRRPTGAPLTCNELTSRAQAALQPLRDGADEACQIDADCTEFPDVSCTSDCQTVIISKNGLSAIQSQIDAIDQGLCSQFNRQGCVAIPKRCPFPGSLGCVHGQCQHVSPGAQLDGGSCDSHAEQIHNTLLDALDKLDKSCKVDADCTRVQPELSCEYGCPVDASKTSAAAFVAMRAGFERDLCASYNMNGCRPVITGCPATAGDAPKCLQGVCIDVFTTTTDPAQGKSCAERTAQMSADIQPSVDAADKQCKIDADCDVVMLVNACMESCTYVPASTQGAAAIRAELGALETQDCSWFTQAGCTVQRLPCVAPPTPKCNAGVCSVQ
jgi:hypothetical protein